MKTLLWILLAALIGFEAFAITPGTRFTGDSILLNKRLYYFGGRHSNSDSDLSTLQDLIYLDISTSFNVAEAQSKWQIVPADGGLTPERNYAYAMGVIPDEKSIMIYGGAGDNVPEHSLTNAVLLFNATSNRWSSLSAPPGSLKQTVSGTCSRGDDHKAYVFGGVSWPIDAAAQYSREMFIYDFKASMWSNSTPVPLEMGVRYRAAITLAGKDIYYIGGMTAHYNQTGVSERDLMVPMTDILVFHIDTSKWELKKALGPDIPAARISHTIASKPNSQDIILYGGKADVPSTNPIPDYCYVLDTRSMSWTKKDPIGQGPGALYGQAAVFADNSRLLFVMFGVNKAGTVQSGFGVLDTETWAWSENYLSSYSGGSGGDTGGDTGGSDSGNANNSDGLSNGAIGGIVVGCVAGVALIAAFFFIRKRRNRNGKDHENLADGEFNDTIINNGTAAAATDGRFKPEDTNRSIPNATLSPLLPAESAPPYRGHIPDEIDPPIALSVQNTSNAQAAPRPQNLRAVKPDGE